MIQFLVLILIFKILVVAPSLNTLLDHQIVVLLFHYEGSLFQAHAGFWIPGSSTMSWLLKTQPPGLDESHPLAQSTHTLDDLFVPIPEENKNIILYQIVANVLKQWGRTTQ